MAECVELQADDLVGLLSFAQSHQVDLTVVGPEQPLSLGLVDRFQAAGLRVFGPTKAAAMIESSKVYAKRFMEDHGVPTAVARSFDSVGEAVGYAKNQTFPLVIKADGLASGKGVIIAQAFDQAEEAIYQMMRDKVFGRAGERVVVEEFLKGEEATVLAFTDGQEVCLMPAAQDHKRLMDGDQGPNTGGMGAYAPAPVVTPGVQKQVLHRIIKPTLAGLAQEGSPYKGVLYCGLMICADGPRVLEFNCRFGDPEAQAVLPLLDCDFVDLLEAAIEGRLNKMDVRWKPQSTVCVVMASKGYPGECPKGLPIEGLEKAQRLENVLVFHAGTALQNGRTVTHGGRVLGITAFGSDLFKARERAYEAVRLIHFEGMQYRTDIGARAISRV